MDIGNLLSSTKVALQKQATDSFGATVADFVSGKMADPPSSAVDGTGTYQPTAQTDPNTWYSSSYAAALAGTSFRPKLKFLFKVEFAFNDKLKEEKTYAQLFDKHSNDFTFLIKSVDRPKVDFDYEEEVNQYNFRTKVLKKITHRELTLTFMDDVGNRVFDFFRLLMLIYSPITRGGPERDNVSTKPTVPAQPASGMSFLAQDKKYNAHRGVIDATAGQAIKYIRVKQVFMDPSSSMRDAPHVVYYDFMNPRLKSFDLDDLNHETSDPNLLTMMFDYDWMEMVKMDRIPANSGIGPLFPGVSAGAPTAPVDLLGGAAGALDNASLPGGNNPFTKIISGKLGGAAQQLTSTLINRAVTSVAGKGAVGTALGGAFGAIGSAVGNSVNGYLGNQISSVSGVVSSSASSLLSGATSSISSKFTSMIRPAATDSTSPGGVKSTIIGSGGS
jgi:hypothetical protein